MTTPSHEPRKIEPHGQNELLLGWNTGEEFVVPYVEVRFFCPCASCVDEHTGQRIIQRGSVKPDIRPTNVQPVGRYAISFSWSDGHQTGIYHYDTLWKLCEKHGRRLHSIREEPKL